MQEAIPFFVLIKQFLWFSAKINCVEFVSEGFNGCQIWSRLNIILRNKLKRSEKWSDFLSMFGDGVGNIADSSCFNLFLIQVAISQIEKFGFSQSIAVYAELHLLMLSSCKRLRKRFWVAIACFMWALVLKRCVRWNTLLWLLLYNKNWRALKNSLSTIFLCPSSTC